MSKLKEIIGFRALGFVFGALLLERQYSFGGELTSLFHYFPNILILTYLADMGYSEYLTKSNSSLIHYSFLKRNSIFFLLALVAIFFLKDAVDVLYILPLLIVPIQAVFDAMYRIILKLPSGASKFFIFQTVQPLLLYIALKVVNLNMAWEVFLILNVLVPVLFLTILKLLNKLDIKVSFDKVEYSVKGGFFLYKISPLLIYLFLSFLVNIFPRYVNECYMIIRIAYFILGIILLFLYSGGRLNGAETKNYFIIFAAYSLLIFLLFVGYSFIKGYFIFKDTKLLSISLLVIICSSACFSLYILKYINWLKKT